METFQLYYMKKAFAPIETRFTNLRVEAMRLRYLWTYEQRPTRRRTDQELRNLYAVAVDYIKTNENLLVASALIKKILKHDPRSPVIHALRGNIYKIQGKWTHAIKSYEVARLMEKVASYRISRYPEDGVHYVESLIKCYEARGDSYYESGLFLQAASDYERALELKPPGMFLTDVEDKLLGTMKRLDKYEAFYSYWLDFVRTSDPIRVSYLLTLHAEYKFFLRDIKTAREFLVEALDLDQRNARARQLLQKMYELGRTMSIHAIIWSMYRSYDKALFTIEKVRDCDPSNLQYVLLKAIMFRLSGRSREAIACLGEMKEVLERRMASSPEMLDPCVPLLSLQEIREQIKRQFLLAKYNSEVQSKVEEKNTRSVLR